MKKGSPEWMRAKYAEMMVAHLSIFEEDQMPRDPAGTAGPIEQDAIDNPARTDEQRTPPQGGDHAS